jgi:hypothetical protein
LNFLGFLADFCPDLMCAQVWDISSDFVRREIAHGMFRQRRIIQPSPSWFLLGWPARQQWRISMAGPGAEMVRIVRRNKLVGFWAAEKLALAGENAKTYSDGLAMAALDVERSDILAIIRRDFDAAGVVQSDDDILAVMNVCWLEAGKRTKGSDGSDAALVQIARHLMQGS